jgi:hypothetical protein
MAIMNFADILLVDFRSHIRAKVIPAEAACLVAGRGLTAPPGSAITMLAPLDGTRTMAELTRDAVVGEGNGRRAESFGERAAAALTPVNPLSYAGMLHVKPGDKMILDQTGPDINVPAVKVVVALPRHFWPQFAVGRLFRVTVRLGPLTKRASYSELSFIPLYL